MKRILQLTTIIIILLSMTIAFAPGAIATTSFTTTASVHLRNGPSTDDTIVRSLYSGTNVEMLEHNPSGWSRVRVFGDTGFIRSDFLALRSGAGTLRTTDGVHVRAGASTDYRILTTVNSGTQVQVLNHDPAGWSRVSVGGTTGFIRSDFLTGSTSVSASSNGTSQATVQTTSTPTTLMTISGVNLRSGPSTSDRVLGSLSAGTNVNVLQHNPTGWTRVDNGGSNAYIRSDFLAPVGTAVGSGSAVATLMTTSGVNLRSGPSTNDRILRTVVAGTNVTVLEHNPNDWSRVSISGTTGFIRSDLLATPGTPISNSSSPQTLRTTTGVNLRSGPSTNHDIVRVLGAGTSVQVIGQADGWSNVQAGNVSGFIRSDLLRANVGGGTVELADISTLRTIARPGTIIHIRDIRTGITYNLRVLSAGGHLDVEPPTQADTDALRRTYGGRWSWAARPVFATVNGRTFAAAMTGMPHSVSTVRNNGVNGHFCLHFHNTVTRNQRYQADLRSAVAQAWAAR